MTAKYFKSSKNEV